MDKRYGFFCIATHLGGAERSLLDFLKHSGWDKSTFVVFTSKSDGPLLQEISELGIRQRSLDLPHWLLRISRKRKVHAILTLPLLVIAFPIVVYKIYRGIRGEDIDVAHSTGIKFHLLLGVSSLFCRDVAFFLHFRDIIRSQTLRFVFGLFQKRKNIHLLANSKVTANTLKPLTSRLIYNGFDTELYKPTESNIKSQLGIPETAKVISNIAAIAEWKGQRDFIQVALKLLDQRPDLYFFIIGDEIYDTAGEKGELEYLKTWVKQQGQQNRILFLGFQKNLVPFYNASDVVVHTSRAPEPFGRVVVEAMLCGRPVTASDQGGPLEIIEPRISGLLHQTGNLKSIRANIESIIDSKEDKQALGQRARERSSQFSMEKYILNMQTALSQAKPQI